MTEQELYNGCHARYYYKDGQLLSKRTHKPLGSIIANGYLQMSTVWTINGLRRRVILRIHRIIFLLCHGYLPDIVDHINGNTTDNRIENLRAATLTLNSVNRAVSSRNKLGVKGVVYDSRLKKYVAYIKVNGKSTRIGGFAAVDEAAAAYNAKAQEMHGQYAVHNR